MADKFELRNAEGEAVWTGNDRKGVAMLDLPEGEYQLWKFQGTLPVRYVPARRRVVFQSATKKGPRKPRVARGSAAAGETVSGEAIA